MTTTLSTELVAALRRLRLGRMTDTLADRLDLARAQEMGFEDLLTLLLTDEIARRDSTAAQNRASQAGLEPDMTIERWDKTAKVSFDKRLLASTT